MRILKIKLKNLYTLCGSWEIDFTHSNYEKNAIFSIAETDGNNHSIIPNAISLALYGKSTPMMAPDRIITKCATMCLAEIDFSVNNKNYRCRWSFDKSVDDTIEGIKPLKHVIIDLDVNRAFNIGSRDVPKKIEEICGFGFKNFYRAIILPQGGFDNFLKFSGADNAELLEYLTGNEIYLDLARKMTHRSKAEISGLEALKARMEEIKPLEKEKFEEFNTKARHLEKKIAREKRYKDESKEILTWCENIKDLEDKEIEITGLLKELELKEESNVENVKALQLREKALNFAEEYSELRKVKKQLADIESNIKSKVEEEKLIIDKLTEFEKKFATAEQVLIETENNQKKSAKKIAKARELDLEIASADKARASKESQLVAIIGRLDRLKSKINNATKDLVDKEKEFEKITKLLETTNEESNIEQNLLTWKMESSSLVDIKDDLLSKQNEIDDLEKDLTESLVIQKKISEELELKEIELKSSDDNSKEDDLKDDSNDNNLSELRAKRKTLEAKSKDFEMLPSLIANSMNLKKKLAESSNKKESYAVNIESFEIKASKLRESKEQQLKLVKSYEDKFSVFKKLTALEEYRFNLKEHEACPLCGALEHPYITDMPELKNSDNELDEAKEKLNEINDQLNSINIDLEVTRKNLEQEKERFDDLSVEFNIAEKLCLDKQEDLLLEPESEFDDDYLKFIGKKVELSIQSVESISKQIDVIEASCHSGNDVGMQLNNIKHQLHEVKSNLDFEKKNEASLQKSKEKYISEYENIKSKFDSKFKLLKDILEKFEIELEIDSDDYISGKNFDIEAIQKKMDLKRKEYQEKISSKDDLAKEIEAIKSDILHNKNAYEHRIDEKKEIEVEYKKARRSCDRLKVKRDVFGSQDLTAEADNMDLLVELALKGLAKARDLMNAEKLNKEQNDGQIKAFTANKAELLGELGSLTNQLLMSIRKAGFMNFESFELAYNSKKDSNEIKEIKNELDKEKIELEVKKRDVEVRLQIESGKNSTDKTLEELQQEIHVWNESIRIKQQQLNELYSKLDGQAFDKNSKLDNIIAKITRLKEEINKWGDFEAIEEPLKDKVFCDNAQSLVLDILVSFANRYMKIILPKYKLSRCFDSANDNNKLLSLNVRDVNSANKQKSITEILAEERFLVSLSLTLALGTITNTKAKMSSIFIEEGFSDLNEDSLKKVLVAIEPLKDEGLLIGFISCMDKLMKLYPCKLKVDRNKTKASHSQLTGCGVSELEKLKEIK